MADISEADWKIFKKIRERALDKYCLKCLAEYKAIADKADLSPHERYGLNYQTVRERDKTMAQIFDAMSRSRAFLQLLMIRREELADEDLIVQLSEKLQAQTEPKNIQ